MITVVGIGADGWSGLTAERQQLVTDAPTLIGGQRHLDLIPSVPQQRRLPWPSPLRPQLSAFLDDAGPDAVVLASGDPLVSGIGTTLHEVVGADAVRILPAVSSVALARARMGWSAEESRVVTVVGRDVHRVRASFGPGERLLVLSADETTPSHLAALLTEDGYGPSLVTVLGNLGSDAETRLDGIADYWAGASPRLNIVAVDVRPEPGTLPAGVGVALADRDFDSDGQLTKLPLRLLALAHLRPAAHQLLWDVGTGAGSIGIEWTRANPLARAIGIEQRPDRAERARANATRHGVADRLRVVDGAATAVLSTLPTPDAVFFGGGATRETVSLALGALPVGGRLVVHSVTLETDELLSELHATLGGQLTRLNVESAQPLGRFRGWRPARTVTCWAYLVESSEES